MITKLPRYKVSFGYVCPMTNKNLAFGKLEEKIFTFKDLEFFLKILSPFNSLDWIKHIKMMNKNSIYHISFDETTKIGTLKKVIKISR